MMPRRQGAPGYRENVKGRMMNRMRTFSPLALRGASALLIALFAACSSGNGKQMGPKPVPVAVGDVVRKDVPVQVRTIGNVEAYNTVSIKALVGGEVEGVYFREGQDVRKGDLLFKIDPRPYEAALKQAEAALARDLAQAKNAEEQARRYAILV